MTEIATSKAENLLQARDRHQKEVEEKMRQAEMRRQAEEAARRKNYLESQSIKEKRIAHQNMLALNN